MKKLKYIFLILLYILPTVLYASTYSAEVNKTNGLLNKENYIHTYEKYIVHGSNIKFEYSDNLNKYNSTFQKGGFVSLEEFNLTKRNNVSYLFEGIEFWTLSKNGTNVYAITYGDTNTAKNPDLSYSGRATEFVNPNVTVKGKGTLSNPWTFDSMYKVTAVVDERFATIESGNDVYVRGGCTNADCTANIVITPKTGYRYITNDCNGQYDETNHILSVNNLKRDTTCNVSFGKGLFKITLTKGTPNTIYLKHGENYYKESNTKTIIRKIESVTPKTGYTFIGYFHNSHKIINGLKEPQTDDNLKILYDSVINKYITSDVTLEPTYEANEYKVIFNCNGGSNPPTTQLITYDNQFTLTSSVCQRAGYIQPSWNTKADGTGETWTVANHTDVKWQISHDVTLYAVWNACAAGTYNAGTGSNTCTPCSAGTYNTGTGNSTCTSCPAGKFNTGTGNTSCTACVIGSYNTGTGNTSCTSCGAGKTTSAAGSTTCTDCTAITGLNSWAVSTWNTNNTMSNLCTLDKCNAGYRKSGNTCIGCGPGTYSANVGSESCTNCEAGKFSSGSVNTTCTTCVAGSYSTAGSSKCTACGAGKTSTAGSAAASSCTNCTAIAGLSTWATPSWNTNNTMSNLCTLDKCLAGYKKTGNSCSGCGPGTYSSTAGSTTCSNCAAGKYSNGTANTGCTTCAAGSYSAAGSSACTPCGAGKTSAAGSIASTSCTNCTAISQLATWATPTWNSSNNTMSNLCTPGTCNAHYRVNGTTCEYLCGSGYTTNSTSGCGSWSNWGNCSASCGGGTQSHTRTCPTMSTIDPNHQCSTWTQTDSQSCNTGACPTPDPEPDPGESTYTLSCTYSVTGYSWTQQYPNADACFSVAYSYGSGTYGCSCYKDH